MLKWTIETRAIGTAIGPFRLSIECDLNVSSTVGRLYQVTRQIGIGLMRLAADKPAIASLLEFRILFFFGKQRGSQF